MGLFSDIGRGALGWSTGGLSEIARLNSHSGGGSQPYQMKPLADPNTIMTDPSLAKALGAPMKKGQNDIGSVYDRIRTGFKADSKARGVTEGSYAPGRINTAQDLSEQDLTNRLQAVLGDTAYKDFQGDRGYSQQEGLAREIASLNSPSTLEEILGGLGGAAGVGGGLYAALGNRKTPAPAQPLPYWALNGYGSQDYGGLV